MKIIKIHLEHLRAENHYEFMTLFRLLLDKFDAVKALIIALYANFIALLADEGLLVDAMKGSPVTRQLVEADRYVDRLVVGINGIITAGMHHFDPKMVAAANNVHDRMKSFGNIEHKDYEAEAAAVRILVADLNNHYSVDVATLGLHEWIDNLGLAIAEFERLFVLRNTEIAARPDDTLIGTRKQIDAVYRSMTALIDAGALIDGKGTYDEFIRELSREAEYANEHIHHHARKDINAATVDAIPVQAYTGQAVIVIPTVRYVTENKPPVDLVFATDFTVTYRNNTKPGTADLIIHGKGAYYKGTKTVTFNIASEIKN
jgi:hypothetical protein